MASQRRRKEERDPLFDGEFIEPHDSDLGLCAHGLPDDRDCSDCRHNGCHGGGDCDCRNRASQRMTFDETGF